MSDNFHSRKYWNQRYISGGNSGSGSYGRLSVYKAHFVNELVHQQKIKAVIELGSGDGNQASLFSIQNYTGVDVSEVAIAMCNEMFSGKKKWRFISADDFDGGRDYGMSMSLDVIYHLIEDRVFETYMRTLFGCARRFVLIYSSDCNEVCANEHVKHRSYSTWVADNISGWQEHDSFEQPFQRTELSNRNHTTLAFFRLYERIRKR